MYRSVNGFMGAAAIEVIKQYSFDRAFLGSCGVGYDEILAVTTSGVEDGLTKKAAVQSSIQSCGYGERSSILTNLINIHILMISSGSLPDEFPDDTICVNILRNNE